MIWAQILLQALVLVNALVKLARENSDDPKQALDKMKQINKGAKESRKNGNTKHIEAAFRTTGLHNPGVVRR